MPLLPHFLIPLLLLLAPPPTHLQHSSSALNNLFKVLASVTPRTTTIITTSTAPPATPPPTSPTSPTSTTSTTFTTSTTSPPPTTTLPTRFPPRTTAPPTARPTTTPPTTTPPATTPPTTTQPPSTFASSTHSKKPSKDPEVEETSPPPSPQEPSSAKAIEGDEELEVAAVNATKTELHLFLCNLTTDGEEPRNVTIPHWLRVPISSYKADTIASSFLHPLFTFSVTQGPPPCAGPNGLRTEEAVRNKTDRNNTFFHLRLGEELERSDVLKASHWRHYFMPNGYFKSTNYYTPPSRFCVSKMTEEELEVALCPPREKKDVVVKKCCPLGTVIKTNPATFIGTDCVETVVEWEPLVERRGDAGEGEEIRAPYFHYRSFDYCDNDLDGLIPNENFHISGTNLADVRILGTGTVVTRATGNRKWDRPKYDPVRYIEEYCIDGLIPDFSYFPPEEEQGGNETRRRGCGVNGTDYYEGEELCEGEEGEAGLDYEAWDPDTYVSSHQNQVLLFCPNNATLHEAKSFQVYNVLYFALLCVATPFHFLTWLVYMLVAGKQNVHGWTTAAFSFASFLNYASIALGHAAIAFQERNFVHFRSSACVAIAVVNHFGYLAQFAWMTVLNLDLWLTISSMVPMMGRSKGLRRFLAYCTFGFGAPAIAVIIAGVLESNFGLFEGRVIRPEWGYVGCTVDDSAYLYHKLIPTLLLYCANLVFIALTCLSLYRFKKDTVRVTNSNSKTSRSQVRLFAKLFVLMGVTWGFDILSWLMDSHETLTWLWAIFDTWNILQAIALFWLFVCKKEIKDHLCTSYKAIQYVWDLVDGKKKAKKLGPSSSFAGQSTSNAGETHSVSMSSRMQSVRLARLKSTR